MDREKDIKEYTAAIVLAAGSGRRMGSDIKKQYMPINDKPVLYHALTTFENSFIDEIILAVSPGDIDFCRKEIVDKYGFKKVSHIVEGGRERYHSVAVGLQCLENCDYVFIHDGARPLVSRDILDRAYSCVRECGACVAGMPVKDTIKIVDEAGNITATPNRNFLWMVQTPQVFSFPLIKKAYETLLKEEKNLEEKGIVVTDDAMVVENLTGHPVKVVEGSYKNIKITTPEDIQLAETFSSYFHNC